MFAMFAADEFGSVAEMPLGATSADEAKAQTVAWLQTYDHGFSHATIANAAEITLLAYATTAEIHAWISARSARPSTNLVVLADTLDRNHSHNLTGESVAWIPCDSLTHCPSYCSHTYAANSCDATIREDI
jgi:hypothetical protein